MTALAHNVKKLVRRLSLGIGPPDLAPLGTAETIEPRGTPVWDLSASSMRHSIVYVSIDWRKAPVCQGRSKGRVEKVIYGVSMSAGSEGCVGRQPRLPQMVMGQHRRTR